MIKQIPNPANNKTPLPPRELATPDQRETETAKRAATELSLGFGWSRTAEGSEFWNGVYERLNQISQDGILKD